MVVYILRRYLTLQFPRTLMKALLMDSRTPVPETRSTEDVGNPTLVTCMLEEKTHLFVQASEEKHADTSTSPPVPVILLCQSVLDLPDGNPLLS